MDNEAVAVKILTEVYNKAGRKFGTLPERDQAALAAVLIALRYRAATTRLGDKI